MVASTRTSSALMLASTRMVPSVSVARSMVYDSLLIAVLRAWSLNGLTPTLTMPPPPFASVTRSLAPVPVT